MKRKLLWSLMLLPILLTGFGAVALAEQAELPEWTFMLYMCGSDLESTHGLASYNLREIASLWFPEKLVVDVENDIVETDWRGDGVNLVMQTGGARRWHSLGADANGNSLNIQIASDRLQRYQFDMVYSSEQYGYVPSIKLVEEQPLASMSDPETLAEFIRWSVERYPAKKYGLLLWDHGGGSRTGLFVDELFGNDILYLNELGAALNDGGAHFELIAIDACLMCSLETAQMLAPHANYMVASEEEMSGYGSAFADWINELYRKPGCNGGELGRVFCDATQRKYSEQYSVLTETMLTYSTIRLDRISAVAEGFDRLFEFAGRLYEEEPTLFNMFCNQLISGESYGAGNVDMVDLGCFLYNKYTLDVMDAGARNALVQALADAVYYNVKGSGRSESKGLSFCYSPNMSPEEMDIYARNCQSASYLALLDAVNSDWQAPEWVYETARRLTPIEDLAEYHVELELFLDDGLPKLHIPNLANYLFNCVYSLYTRDKSGRLYALGEGPVFAEWNHEREDICFTMNGYGHWPSIDGELCCVKLINTTIAQYLYNVPVQINTDTINLRLREMPLYDKKAGQVVYEYEAVGLWSGYDKETRMPNRAVIPFQQMQGRDLRLLYPYCDESGVWQNHYRLGNTMTVYRALDVEYTLLPAGEYYCGYTVYDIFRREYRTKLVKLHWDGLHYTAADR